VNLTGNPAVLRRVNRVRILNKLFFQKSLSKAQLARETGLDPKTMTNLCTELQQEKLLLSQPAPALGRGRPGELLKLNPQAAFSIGVDVGPYHVTAVLLDFAAGIRKKWQRTFRKPATAKTLLRATRDGIETLKQHIDGHPSILQGICIVIPGLISHKEGTVIRAVNIPKLNGLNLVDVFADVKSPIFVEGSSHAQSIAEKWLGGHYNDSNFITLDIGYGIGMGIMYHGELNRGANERSGEIGHTVVLPNGPTCTCGKNGCLEIVASGSALEKVAAGLPLAENGIKSRGAKAIYELAKQGDETAINILSQSGTYIGIAIANAVTLFDPGVVILNGGLVRAGDFLLDSMNKSIQQNLMALPNSVSITTSHLGDVAGALGAAMVPLQHYFEWEKFEL
jgi:predicted NBD/HSP70 family sugar kinase